MSKAKASAGLRIGEGVLSWASLSSKDASAALIAATGCSASELSTLLKDDLTTIPRVASILCGDVDAVLTAWSAGDLDVPETRAALIAELSKLIPEGGDNGDV